MEEVKVGIVGLGNVGSGTLAILAENADQVALKLGFRLKVAAVCSRSVHAREIPAALGPVFKTTDWREVVKHPDVQIVAELVGGATVAAEIVNGAIQHRKSVVTANKELMAACGPEIWERAIQAGINLAMEASVCGGIPIHAVLREGISGDRVVALLGILNGTCNYILTEMERRDVPLATVLAEAQKLGYAEADPSADIDGFDARSKLVLLAALAFGEKITPSDIFMEGIRRITPLDFRYARQLKHTIRLLCGARITPDGLILSVRPALLPVSTILAGVQGPYNAVWVKGRYGEDTCRVFQCWPWDNPSIILRTIGRNSIGVFSSEIGSLTKASSSCCFNFSLAAAAIARACSSCSHIGHQGSGPGGCPQGY